MELRSLWRECLRAAWTDAIKAQFSAQLVEHRSQQTEADRLRDALRFEEVADRGYDHYRAAALRAQLATLAEAA